VNKKNITFTQINGLPEINPPEPASNLVPDWYKNTDSYLSKEKIPNGSGKGSASIKRCMPVFDAMVAGYIIKSHADVFVSQRDGQPYFEWSSAGMVEFHPIEQAPLHPLKNGAPYPKWMNSWAIKTPKGYSVLVVQPMHRESPFTILPGVVDSDTYKSPINFPFVLNDLSFTGLIPAGTPIAQVIPFKRDSWEMSLGNIGDMQEVNNINAKLQTKIFDGYKTLFRQPKDYK
jgi:hypothetical protein